MKYYIATRLENHGEHNRLRDLLKLAGHECTYDWTQSGSVTGDLQRISEIAQLEIAGVLSADFVIALWPAGRGTHVEIGAAIARGIPVLFVSDVPEHHEACRGTCAFYHHPRVRRFRSISELIKLRPEIFTRASDGLAHGSIVAFRD